MRTHRENTRDGKVVDVVASSVSEGPALSKPRQSCVHQSRVECQAALRPQPQLLHHPRPVGLNEDVRSRAQVLYYLNTHPVFQVDCNGALVSAIAQAKR